ncbi:hypothetical protein SAMN04515647_3401 [Cohaesibacter sp. ES.047]|uniref:hypothetical protein n=1 Tax=Cohaesibacter sp. ES.047 TaxID=1798205 RepID=UPI000BC0781A|nr:hypothetical protein [Cohaesibacter sp. ES.047]SNY93125.1 hypothetical protein SAMN04515647_3401 [Cohaesibacter sp. ES.047]
MTLGLSPRCVGGNDQKIIYDDLALPEFSVAEGEVSSSYHFSSSRNISWRMSNEYLRNYLWMRGKYGTRVFFYEANITDTPDITTLLGAKTHINFKPDGGWYDLCIRRINGKILVQLWAVVCSISPEKCQLQSADSLTWPGVSGVMNHQRANALVDPSIIYLDDRFLERYEQNSFYETTPFEDNGSWTCNPSYSGQWSFTDCRRIGRNLIKVRLRELYKGKPDREIVWAHSHTVALGGVDQTDLEEEHIVAKVQRFLDTLLDLADGLAWLAGELGSDGLSSEELIGISREELRAERWLPYPKLSRLAQVAPLDMTEQQFLSRCKEIHELWQKLPNGVVRKVIDQAGHDSKKYKSFGSLKLLQVLTNVLERLNSNRETVSSFDAGHQDAEVTGRDSRLAPLFLTADLRNADAHIGGSISQTLSDLGFDMSQTNSGYGRALDYVFDQNIASFAHVTSEIDTGLSQTFLA